MAKLNNIKLAISQLGDRLECNEQVAVVKDVVVFPTAMSSRKEETSSEMAVCDQQKAPKLDLKVFVREKLVEGKDFGTIPGVKNKILFKRGALKILKYFGYRHHDELLDKKIDVKNGFLGYTVRVSIINHEGEIITEAVGSANSLESKFVKQGFGSDKLLITIAEKRALVCAVKELLTY